MSNLFKGIALPWGTTIPSVIEPKDDDQVIRSSIMWIVLTSMGERVMLPEFGCDLSRMMADPADTRSLDAMRDSIRSAVRRWDNRVELVDVQMKREAANTVQCKVIYKIVLDPFHSEMKEAQFDLTEQSFGG